MLLTRSPLGLPRYCYRMDPARLACIRHAASVRPEPGSNSPSRSRARWTPANRWPSFRPVTRESRRRRGFLVGRLAPEQTDLSVDWCCVSSERSLHDLGQSPGRGQRSPALAFSSSIPFSRSTAPRVGAAHPSSACSVGSTPERDPPAQGPVPHLQHPVEQAPAV